MPAHLMFLLRPYPLHLLHQKHRQILLLSSWNLVFGENNEISLSCLGVHDNNQVRPCTSHVFSTESKGTTSMQKPGNNAKA
jgi:hypothetical protein